MCKYLLNDSVMTQLDNDIAVEPVAPTELEQVVELSILLTGEIYTDNLDDPSSLQFQTLSRQLAEKVCLLLPLFMTHCTSWFIAWFMFDMMNVLLVLIGQTHTHTYTEVHTLLRDLRGRVVRILESLICM